MTTHQNLEYEEKKLGKRRKTQKIGVYDNHVGIMRHFIWPVEDLGFKVDLYSNNYKFN